MQRWGLHLAISFGYTAIQRGAHVGDLTVANDDHDAGRVETTSACSTRHLRVLASEKVSERPSIMLPNAREYDGPSGHVDPLTDHQSCGNRHCQRPTIAKVSVAKRTLTRPRANRISTICAAGQGQWTWL